jgi:hypothetical protein
MDYIVLPPIMFEEEKIRRTSDGRVSVFDIIRVIGGQKNPYEVVERLQKQYPDVLTDCENIKFPGRGQKETPVINKQGALSLIGLLPGEAGAKYRSEAAALVLQWYESPEELAVKAFDKITNTKTIKRTKSRIDGIVRRKTETQVFADTGLITQGWQYGVLTNATYTNLFGADCKTLKQQKGLPEKASLRDAMDDVELAALAFAEALSARNVEQQKPGNFSELKQVVSTTAHKISLAF